MRPPPVGAVCWSSSLEPKAQSLSVLARKVHRPRFSDDNHLDLSGILQFRFDATSDFIGQRRHAGVVDVLWGYQHAHFTARLNRIDLVHPAIAGGDLLDSLQSLDVRLERFAPRAGP